MVHRSLLFNYIFIFISPLIVLASAGEDSGFKLTDVDSDRTVVLEVSQVKISSDCTIRPSVVINGTSPGPELRFKEGQRVKIRVINRLQKHSTTIHFHGISQKGSPFSDGTEKISQFAIPPRGGYFDYVFYLERGSAGTYLYHAHMSFHMSTAYAAFIVEDAGPPPFKYDEELVMIFGDYYHALNEQIVAGLKSVPFKWLGEPQSLVVNGNALAPCNISSTYGCSGTCHHNVAIVKPDKVYRVRVIGITVLTYLYFGIEAHSSLDVIEVDGGYVRPARTDHIELHSGQRYSFLLKTKSKAELRKLGSKTDFWGRIESRWRAERDHGAFLLRYEDTSDGGAVASPQLPQFGNNESKSRTSSLSHVVQKSLGQDLSRSPAPPIDTFKALVPLPDEGKKWLTETFEPLDPTQIAPTAKEVTRRIVIKGQQRKLPDGSIKWFVNGQTHVETGHKVPFLVRAYTTGLKPNYTAAERNNGYDAELAAYPIKLNETVEIVFINQASTAKVTEAHPWHIHGQAAFMIAYGTGEFNDQNLAIEEAKFNKKHIRRDTQVVFAGKGAIYSNTTVPVGTQSGWVALRMKATTPGAFMFHCHTQAHVTLGMSGVLLIGIEHLPPLPAALIKELASPVAPPTSILANQTTACRCPCIN